MKASSPRMWGCFQDYSAGLPFPSVFPTHVGVFPVERVQYRRCQCLPHACGGVSRAHNISPAIKESSPRMWGCFHFIIRLFGREWVFPTHVGVFLSSGLISSGGFRLPHACGGVSEILLRGVYFWRSSPRMWGCFQTFSCCCALVPVFPTHVGVFLTYAGAGYALSRLPHACGGVSI